MKAPHEIIRAPLITEKGTHVSETAGQVVFQVDRFANKADIRRAIEELFKVKVAAVRTVNYLGKSVRRGRTLGRKASWKKAYITLAEGESADLFDKV